MIRKWRANQEEYRELTTRSHRRTVTWERVKSVHSDLKKEGKSGRIQRSDISLSPPHSHVGDIEIDAQLHSDMQKEDESGSCCLFHHSSTVCQSREKRVCQINAYHLLIVSHFSFGYELAQQMAETKQ